VYTGEAAVDRRPEFGRQGLGREHSDKGAVTAEAVMVLPVLLAVTVGLVWLLAVGAGQIRMVDAARETARAVARGDERSGAIALGARIAPDGTRLRVSQSAEHVIVTAEGEIDGPGGLFQFLPEVRLHAESVALVEEGTAGDAGHDPTRRDIAGRDSGDDDSGVG
jgi:TadE-like protein